MDATKKIWLLVWMCGAPNVAHLNALEVHVAHLSLEAFPKAPDYTRPFIQHSALPVTSPEVPLLVLNAFLGRSAGRDLPRGLRSVDEVCDVTGEPRSEPRSFGQVFSCFIPTLLT